ncbi:f-box only protein 33 [Caerostris extrusa]|uniref:F-box only protein 33 n=1 Tax=Caerostris extrusa TaxID=172846 RepID=A0AAV4Y621_CAEEX|nr:f-box only protein 33 [Caerostris extrusa]
MYMIANKYQHCEIIRGLIEIPGDVSLQTPHSSVPSRNSNALSIDYDHLNDHFLDVFSQPHRKPLSQLIIHVHSFDYSFPQATEVGADSLIAVSRLRGEQITDLKIPDCCISSIQLEESQQLSPHGAIERMKSEVRYSLGQYWEPMTYSELPLAVCNVNIDADGAYLDELLRDQMW